MPALVTVVHPENRKFTKRKAVDGRLDNMIREWLAQQPEHKVYTRIAIHGGPGVG